MSVSSPQEVISGTASKYDQYAGVQTLDGPALDKADFPNTTKMWLTAGISQRPGGDYIRLAVWHLSQTGWKFLNSASDSDATPLVLRPVDRSVFSRGTIQERVVVDLSESYLQAKATTGLNVRLMGQTGSMIIELQPEYVQGFLERYRQEKSKMVGTKPGLAAQVPTTTADPASPASTGSTGKRVLGVQLYDPPIRGFGMQGMVVTNVLPETPAAKAGLVPGDTLLEYNGQPVGKLQETIGRIASTEPGAKVPVKIKRVTGAVVVVEVQM